MRRLLGADRFQEVTRPVVRIWKEAKQSDANGNIYTVTRRTRGFETVHVAKKSLELRAKSLEFRV